MKSLREGIFCLPTYFSIEQVMPSVNFIGDFHTCSFNNQTRHSVRITSGHYTKSIQTCKLYLVLYWHNIKRKQPQNWIVIFTIFISNNHISFVFF